MTDYGSKVKYVKESLTLKRQDIQRYYTSNDGHPIELRGRPTTDKNVAGFGIELFPLPTGWERRQLYNAARSELIKILGITDASTIGLKWETKDDKTYLWMIKVSPKRQIFEDPLKRNLSIYEKSTIGDVIGGQYVFMPAETDEHLEFIRYHSQRQLISPENINLIERDKDLADKLKLTWGKNYAVHNQELSEYISQTHIPIGYMHADYQTHLSTPHLEMLETLVNKTSPIAHLRFTHLHFDGIFGPQKSSAMNSMVALRKLSMLSVAGWVDQKSNEGLGIVYKDLSIEDCLSAAPTIWAYLTSAYLRSGYPHCVWPMRVVKYKLSNSRWMETVWFRVVQLSDHHDTVKLITKSLDQLIYACKIAYDVSCFTNENIESIERYLKKQ